ncbi:MAG: ATP-binding cassette domain-containing protein [Planctomycetota bacterium]
MSADLHDSPTTLPVRSSRERMPEDAAERCADALCLFLAAAGRIPDKATARRAAGEAVRALPGPPSQQWWRWIREAARAMGVPVRLIDAPPAEGLSVVTGGAAVVTFLPDFEHPDNRYPGVDEPASWWIAGPRDKKASDLRRVVADGTGGADRGGEAGSGSRQSERTFKEIAKPHASESGGTLRWVVAVGAETDLTMHGMGAHPSPWTVLRALFRPELIDIRNVALFALFIAMLNLATPIAVESLVGTVAFGRFIQPVLWLAAILLAFLVFQAALRLLQVWVAELIQRRMYVRVAGDLARRLPRVTGDGMRGHSGPELVNRFFDVVTVQKVAAGLMLDAMNLVLGAVIGLGILAFYHPFLLGFDLVLLSLMTVVTWLLGRGAVKTAIYESKQKYRMAAWLEDLAANPLTFRLSGGPAFAIDRADRLTADYLEARRKHFRILVRQVAFALFLQAAAATALLSLGGWLVIIGELTLGQLVAAELIVTLVLSSFAKMGKHLEAWYDLSAAGDKLGVLFALPTERPDGALSASGVVPLEDRGDELSAGHHIGARLELDDVVVRGGGAFSLTIEPGEVVGVLAPCGSGKTALAEAIFGRRDPEAGQMTLDGLPPRDFRPDALRRHVALAGPAPGGGAETFAGTLAENVHLERPRVTAADVRILLERVGLSEDVDALPEGVDTPLTHGGAPLSEVQTRRLVLARALAGDPRLLVIDSLLDGFSTEEAAELLDAARGSHSMLVMCRRADMLAGCDRIIHPDGSPLEPLTRLTGPGEEPRRLTE